MWLSWGTSLPRFWLGRWNCSLVVISWKENFMCQLVDAPTRNKALLDWLITSNTELIVYVEVRENLGNSDHRVIMLTVNYGKRRRKGSTITLHFQRADFTKLCSILHDIKWVDILETKTMEEKWQCIENILIIGISHSKWATNIK